MTNVENFTEAFLKNTTNLSFRNFIDQNIEFIARNSIPGDDLKQKWKDIFETAALKLNIATSTGRKNPNWGAVALRILDYAVVNSSSTSSLKSTTSKTGSVLITTEDKKRISNMFASLNENKFWVLKKSAGDQEDFNVDKAVANFAVRCNYHHPSQSLIFDLGDKNWEEEIPKDRLNALQNFGSTLFPRLPDDFTDILNQISRLNGPTQAYEYGRTLNYDPCKEPLKAWLALELQQSARLFLYDNDTIDTDTMLESDQMYEVWGFLKTIVKGTSIKAKGSEGSSKANADATNRKRSISAIEPLANRRMGRKIDTIYHANRKEVGCIEIGKKDDQTKEMKDGMMKMPLIMHDMFIQAAATEHSLRQIRILGYVINGCKISMLVMDSPSGYVARIRRSNTLEYPSCKEDYIGKIVPLLKLAVSGYLIMEHTRETICTEVTDLEPLLSSDDWMLPPTFIPVSRSNSATPSSSSSSSSKKQRSD